jgi:D-alanyl-D-alanine carboxypeptidase
MRELIEANIAHAATRRTVAMIGENATPMRAPQLASVSSRTPPEAAAPTAAPAPAPVAAAVPVAAAAPIAAPAPVARAAPAPGSVDPIRPLVVRTIQVRAAAVRTAALGPLVIPAPNSTVVPPQLAPQPAPQAAEPPPPAPAAPAHAVLPPPPGARPGVLGVLPARAVQTEPAPARPAATFVERMSGAPEPQAAAAPAAPVTVASAAAAPARHAAHGEWAIQIGAFPDEAEAQARLRTARSIGAKVLGNADPFTEKVVKGSKELYRARFAGFDRDGAEAACHHFKRNDIACMALKN